MGRRQARTFRPGLDALEERRVMTASPSAAMVHAAIAPVKVPIATYNQTFTKINAAFEAYQGSTVGNALDAIGSLVSTALDPNSSTPSSGSDGASGSQGDSGALQSRLESAIERLPGGKAGADTLIGQTFALGGLTTADAAYFKAKITSLVKQEVSQEVHRGEVTLVWPGHPRPAGRR